MTENVIHIPVETLKRFTEDVFIKLDVPKDARTRQNLRGRGEGI